MTRVNCIKKYFADSERPLDNKEIITLSKEERVEIGDLCANALELPESDREWLKTEGAAA